MLLKRIEKFRMMGLFVLLILLIPFVSSYAGNVCNSSSPCSCGTNCQGGGHENANGYNTIDSCSDGSVDDYEYVHDLSAASLDRDRFIVGDTIQINGTYFCDPSTDYVSISYHNGITWSNIYYTTCSSGTLATFSTTHTLDAIPGNHSVRASIMWSENTNAACASSKTCSYDCENTYSDNDDITFLVLERDHANPAVTIISPGNGQLFELEDDTAIEILVNVSDESSLSSVQANITWDTGSSMLNLSFIDNLYRSNYTNISTISVYNLTIIAQDEFGNRNDSASVLFMVNHTVNITFISIADYQVFGNSSIPLYVEIKDNLTIDSTWYVLNNQSHELPPLSFSNNASPDNEFLINTSDFENLSQSFNLSSGLDVRKMQVSLALKGALSNISIQLRQDNAGKPSPTVIAQGSIDGSLLNNNSFTWVQVIFNTTIHLANSTRYWLVLEPNGDNLNYLVWQMNNISFPQGKAYYNASADAKADFLFFINDAYRYNSTIEGLEGQNALTVHTNNSKGIEKSKTILFSVDTIKPYYTNISFNQTLELGDSQFVEITLFDTTSSLSRVLIEMNSQNYSMTQKTANWFNYSFFPGSIGLYNFRVYFNDSAGNLNATPPFNFTVQDTTPPVIRDITISPSDSEGIDPNITLTIETNVSDELGIDKVLLRYKNLNKGTWSLQELTNATPGIFKGNFTPDSSGIWVYNLLVNDSAGNYNYSENFSINASFDTSWNYAPHTFGVNSSSIGSTKKLLEITLNNTGDYAIRFNISSIATPTLVFNRSPVFELAPGAVEKINVNVTAPIITANYPILIKIQDMNNSIDAYINGTLIVYGAGPYLYLEILEYDSSVIQGDHITNLVAKVINLGNASSPNTSLTWHLPSGWSSRDNVSLFAGNLNIGAWALHNISADVSSSAPTGEATLIAETNNSLGDYNALIKKVSVSSPASAPGTSAPAEIVVVSSGGGSSSSPSFASSEPVFIEQPVYDLGISIGDIAVKKEERKTFFFSILNNGTKELSNISLIINGLFKQYYTLEPAKLKKLDIGEQKNVSLKIELPGYYATEKQQLTLKVISSEKRFQRSFFLFIIDAESSIVSCMDSASKNLSHIASQGYNIAALQEMYDEAMRLYKNSQYQSSSKTCRELAAQISRIYALSNAIKKLDARLGSMKQSGQDITALKKSLDLVHDLLKKGAYEKAQAKLEETQILTAISPELEKPLSRHILDAFRMYLKEILLASAFLLLSLLVMGRYIASSSREQKQRDLKQEEKEIIQLIKRIQKEYFIEKVMGVGLYKKYLAEYQKRMAKIKEQEIALNCWKRFGKKNSIQSLVTQKESIISLLKNLQRSYFENKILARDAYEKLSGEYEVYLADLDRRLKMLEGVKKEEKISYDQRGKKDSQAETGIKKKGRVHRKKVVKKIPEEMCFIMVTGEKIRDLRELCHAVNGLREEEFSHHVNPGKNDFAQWVSDVLLLHELARKMRNTTSKAAFCNVLEKELDNYEIA